MLKISYMARAQDHDSYDGLIAFAKEIGPDMIDFHVMGELQNPDFLGKVKFQCLRAGLPIGYFASGVSMVGREKARGDRRARQKIVVGRLLANSALMIAAGTRKLFGGCPNWRPFLVIRVLHTRNTIGAGR